MAYIWENYSADKHFRVGERISPYLEIAFPDSAGGEVNPMLRFCEIFCSLTDLVDPNAPEEKQSKDKEDLENILFHCLAQLDLLCGLDEKQIRVNALEEEILAGSFGPFCAKHWQELTEHDKRVILHTLAERYGSETTDHWFLRVIQRLWEYASIVREPSTELYYVYVYTCRTDYTETLMEIIAQLFWDLRCDFRVTWLYHYGIIGIDDTMKISAIQIV